MKTAYIPHSHKQHFLELVKIEEPVSVLIVLDDKIEDLLVSYIVKLSLEQFLNVVGVNKLIFVPVELVESHLQSLLVYQLVYIKEQH